VGRHLIGRSGFKVYVFGSELADFRFGICELSSVQDALHFVDDNVVHVYEQNLDNIRKLMGEFSCIYSTLLVDQSSGFRV
jgi:hypothetical protein